MDSDFLSSAVIMNCQSLTHFSRTNNVTKKSQVQLDLVITIRDALNNIGPTHADCDTDHSLICARVRMQPNMIVHSKQKGRFNIDNTTYPEKIQHLIQSIRTALSEIQTESVEGNWNASRDIMILHSAKTSKITTDWYEASITLMEHVIDANRSALITLNVLYIQVKGTRMQ